MDLRRKWALYYELVSYRKYNARIFSLIEWNLCNYVEMIPGNNFVIRPIIHK